ncbi:MAG: hypothetical protein K5856_08500 [Bacteroidaceae bacterium]|nr:hypothetical protein [Bacteroidaceae bacterium]
MALNAKLQFGDNVNKLYPQSYLVADCSFHFVRGYNHAQPESDARCDRVDLTLVAPSKENLTLYDWFISGSSQNGRIVFQTASVGSETDVNKIITFDDAYCYSLAEEYQINNEQQRLLKVSFVADIIHISGVEFDNIYKN